MVITAFLEKGADTRMGRSMAWAEWKDHFDYDNRRLNI
jgi:hypothetical protein